MNLAHLYLGIFFLTANEAITESVSQNEVAISQKQELLCRTVANYAAVIKELPMSVSYLSQKSNLPVGFQTGEKFDKVLYDIMPAISRLRASLGDCLCDIERKIEEAFKNSDLVTDSVKNQILEKEKEIESSCGSDEAGVETFKQYLTLLHVLFGNIPHLLDKAISSPEQENALKVMILLKGNQLSDNSILDVLNSLGKNSDKPIDQIPNDLRNQLLTLSSFYYALIDSSKNPIPIESALMECLEQLTNVLSNKIIVDTWSIIEAQINNLKETQETNWIDKFVNDIKNKTRNSTNNVQQALTDVILNVNIDDLNKNDAEILTKSTDNSVKSPIKTFLKTIQNVIEYRGELDDPSVRKIALDNILIISETYFVLLNSLWESIITNSFGMLHSKDKISLSMFKDIVQNFRNNISKEQFWTISLRKMASLLIEDKGANSIKIADINKRLIEFVPKFMQTLYQEFSYNLKTAVNKIDEKGTLDKELYKKTIQEFVGTLKEIKSKTLEQLGNTVYNLLSNLKNNNLNSIIDILKTGGNDEKITQIFDITLNQMLGDILSTKGTNSNAKRDIENSVKMLNSVTKNTLSMSYIITTTLLYKTQLKLDQMVAKRVLTSNTLKTELNNLISNLKEEISKLSDKKIIIYNGCKSFIEIAQSQIFVEITNTFLKELVYVIKYAHLDAVEVLKEEIRSDTIGKWNYDWINSFSQKLQQLLLKPLTSLTTSIQKSMSLINQQVSNSLKDLNISSALEGLNTSEQKILKNLLKSLVIAKSSKETNQEDINSFKIILESTVELSKYVIYLYEQQIESVISKIATELSECILNENYEQSEIFKILNEQKLANVADILIGYLGTISEQAAIILAPLPSTFSIITMNERMDKLTIILSKIITDKIADVIKENINKPEQVNIKGLLKLPDQIIDGNMNTLIEAVINLRDLLNANKNLANLEDIIEMSFSQVPKDLMEPVLEKTIEIIMKVISQQGVEHNAVIKVVDIVTFELTYFRNVRLILKSIIGTLVNKKVISYLRQQNKEVLNKLSSDIQECNNELSKQISVQFNAVNILFNTYIQTLNNPQLAVDLNLKYCSELGNTLIRQFENVIRTKIYELKNISTNITEVDWVTKTIKDLNENLDITSIPTKLENILNSLAIKTDICLDNFEDIIDAKLNKTSIIFKDSSSKFLKLLKRLLVASKGSDAAGATALLYIIQSSYPMYQCVLDLCSYSVELETSRLEVIMVQQQMLNNSIAITTGIKELKNFSKRLADAANAATHYVVAAIETMAHVSTPKTKDLRNLPSELAETSYQISQELRESIVIYLNGAIDHFPSTINKETIIAIYEKMTTEINDINKLLIEIRRTLYEIQGNIGNNLIHISEKISKEFDKINNPIAFLIKNRVVTFIVKLINVEGLDAISKYSEAIKCMRNYVTNIFTSFISIVSNLVNKCLTKQLNYFETNNLTREIFIQASNNLKQYIYDTTTEYQQAQLEFTTSTVAYLSDNFNNPKYVIDEIRDVIEETLQQANSRIVTSITSKYLEDQSKELTGPAIEHLIDDIKSEFYAVIDNGKKTITEILINFNSYLTDPLMKVFSKINRTQSTIQKNLITVTSLAIAEKGDGDKGIEAIKNINNILMQATDLSYDIYNLKMEQCANELKNQLLLQINPNTSTTFKEYSKRINRAHKKSIQYISGTLNSIVPIVFSKTLKLIDFDTLFEAYYPLTKIFTRTISLTIKRLIQTEINNLQDVKSVSFDQFVQLVNILKQNITMFINTIPTKMKEDFHDLTNENDLISVFIKLPDAFKDFDELSRDVLLSSVYAVVRNVMQVNGPGLSSVEYCERSLNGLQIIMRNIFNADSSNLDAELNNIILKQGKTIKINGISLNNLEKLLDVQIIAVSDSLPSLMLIQLHQLDNIVKNIINNQKSNLLVQENYELALNFVNVVEISANKAVQQSIKEICQEKIDSNTNFVSLIETKLKDVILNKINTTIIEAQHILYISLIKQENSLNSELINLSNLNTDEELKTMLQSLLDAVITKIIATAGNGLTGVATFERVTKSLMASLQELNICTNLQLEGVVYEMSSDLTQLLLEQKLDQSNLQKSLELIPRRISNALNWVASYFNSGLKAVVEPLTEKFNEADIYSLDSVIDKIISTSTKSIDILKNIYIKNINEFKNSISNIKETINTDVIIEFFNRLSLKTSGIIKEQIAKLKNVVDKLSKLDNLNYIRREIKSAFSDIHNSLAPMWILTFNKLSDITVTNKGASSRGVFYFNMLLQYFLEHFQKICEDFEQDESVAINNAKTNLVEQFSNKSLTEQDVLDTLNPLVNVFEKISYQSPPPSPKSLLFTIVINNCVKPIISITQVLSVKFTNIVNKFEEYISLKLPNLIPYLNVLNICNMLQQRLDHEINLLHASINTGLSKIQLGGDIDNFYSILTNSLKDINEPLRSVYTSSFNNMYCKVINDLGITKRATQTVYGQRDFYISLSDYCTKWLQNTARIVMNKLKRNVGQNTHNESITKENVLLALNDVSEGLLESLDIGQLQIEIQKHSYHKIFEIINEKLLGSKLIIPEIVKFGNELFPIAANCFVDYIDFTLKESNITQNVNVEYVNTFIDNLKKGLMLVEANITEILTNLDVGDNLNDVFTKLKTEMSKPNNELKAATIKSVLSYATIISAHIGNGTAGAKQYKTLLKVLIKLTGPSLKTLIVEEQVAISNFQTNVTDYLRNDNLDEKKFRDLVDNLKEEILECVSGVTLNYIFRFITWGQAIDAD